MPRDLAPILGRRVAGPARDADPRDRLAEPLGRHGDAGQRRPQVPLDVVGQGLQRRDVQDANAARGLAGRRRAWVRRQPVEAPQEGGQSLAAPRRRMDERVAAFAMADQPWACASVGAAKLDRNQSWTAGENAASASREGAGDGAREVRATERPV